MGGKYTMGVREGARAASLILADSVIPCHYGQELGQPADIAELSRQVEFLSPGTAVVPLEHTDDPMMFGTTMVDELAGLMEVHGFSFDELVRTLEYAIDASWADAETKAMLRSAQAAEVAPRDANRSK